MTEKKTPVEVWSINCPCGKCDGLLGVGLTDGEMDEPIYAIPVFLSRKDTQEFFAEFVRGKLSRQKVRVLQRKLIRRVDPEEIPGDRNIRCPDGHLHEWQEWYVAITAEQN